MDDEYADEGFPADSGDPLGGGSIAEAGSAPPEAASVPPEPGSPADIGSPQAEMTAEEAEIEQEMMAVEQEIESEYGIEPATPTTQPEPTAHETSAETSTPAPTDMSYDGSGDPERGTAPTSDVIGDPNADASQWSFQGANGYCGPNSISMLVEAATGHHLTEQQIAGWAIDHDEMTHLTPAEDSPAGVPSIHYGMLPEQAVATINEMGGEYGISAKIEEGNMSDLEGYLKGGREVMIELDDQRIWHQAGVKDTDEANHYVVVTGFDPSTDTVFINDPGAPDGKEESLPLSEFESAWSTSDNVMIVTSTSGSPAEPSSPTTTSTPSPPSTPSTGSPSGSAVDEAGSIPGPVLLPITMSSDLIRSD